MNFLKQEEAATAVEYAVMLAAILIACLAGIAAVGNQTGVMYNEIDTEMQAHGIGP